MDRLKPWVSSSEWAALARLSYWKSTEQLNELLADFADKEAPKSAYAHAHHVVALFHARRDDAALQAFDAIPLALQNDSEYMRIYIRMSSPEADRDQIATEFLRSRDFLMGNPAAKVYRHFDIWALQLLGKSEEAKQYAKESRSPTLEDTWPLFEVGNIASGDCEPEELLEACAGDRNALAHAHFGLGVNSLAAANWDDARLQFEQVLKTDQFPLYVDSWSAAFLERMKDPQWLPWLRKGTAARADENDSAESESTGSTSPR